jgi:hypothetical protein
VSDFELWQIIIGVGTVIITIGLSVFGKGFTAWANQLKDITTTVDSRLEAIANDYKNQAEKAERATKELRDEFHNLAISMERRVSRLEVQDRHKALHEDKL